MVTPSVRSPRGVADDGVVVGDAPVCHAVGQEQAAAEAAGVELDGHLLAPREPAPAQVGVPTGADPPQQRLGVLPGLGVGDPGRNEDDHSLVVDHHAQAVLVSEGPHRADRPLPREVELVAVHRARVIEDQRQVHRTARRTPGGHHLHAQVPTRPAHGADQLPVGLDEQVPRHPVGLRARGRILPGPGAGWTSPPRDQDAGDSVFRTCSNCATQASFFDGSAKNCRSMPRAQSP